MAKNESHESDRAEGLRRSQETRESRERRNVTISHSRHCDGAEVEHMQVRGVNTVETLAEVQIALGSPNRGDALEHRVNGREDRHRVPAGEDGDR